MSWVNNKFRNRLRVASYSSGFTLVEMLVVIAIIAILAGFLMPALGTARRQAKEAKAKAMIASLGMALSMYQTDYGVYPPSARSNTEQINGNSSKSDSFQNATVQGYYNLVMALLNINGSGPYMEFRQDDLDGSPNDPTPKPVLLDPWKNAYIYVSRRYYDGTSWVDVNDLTDNGPYHPYPAPPTDPPPNVNDNTYNIYSLGDDGRTHQGVSYSGAGGSDWDVSSMYDNPLDGDTASGVRGDTDLDWLLDDINSWK